MSQKLRYHLNWKCQKKQKQLKWHIANPSPKLKCWHKLNVTKTDMAQKPKSHKSEITSKQKCNQNWHVIITEMSPKSKCPKTKMSPKPKCHQNWNVNKTEIIIILKWHQN